MKHSLLRSWIRNILLETRSTLPYAVILKEWVRVAAESGVAQTNSGRISGPSGRPNAEVALLRIEDQSASAKVFDNLTEEVQEWVLKHWKTKEYFQAMLEGVDIGLVKAYDSSGTAGLKWGMVHRQNRRTIQGTQNTTATFKGYLTARDDFSYSHDTLYSDWSNGKENREVWKKRMFQDLENGSKGNLYNSVLVHEFHHWFQEGVLYVHSDHMRVRKGGKEEDRSNPNLQPPSDLALNMLKASLTCIDWNDTLEMKGILGYKVTDQQQFVALFEDKNAVDPVRIVTSTMDEQKAKDFLINSVARQGLRIGNKLTDEMADKIWKKAFNTFEQTFRYRPIQGWTFIRQIRNVLPLDNDYFKAINVMPIFVMPETDFEKEGKVYTDTPKPDKHPEKASSKKSWEKTRYIWFTKGEQKMPTKGRFITRHDYIRDRNPSEAEKGFGKEVPWNQQWVEFDAELANYTQGAVREWFYNSNSHCRKIMMSDAEGFTKELVAKIERLMTERGMTRILSVPKNMKQLQTVAKRVTDRLVETAEQYDYQYWLDNVASPSAKRDSLWPEKFDLWVTTNRKEGYGSPDWYLQWLFDKASGENV